MAYLCFNLRGDMAMWRNPYEPVGAFSCLGPSPSQIAGLVGAAMGFPSPRSQASGESLKSKSLKASWKRGLVWPVAPKLLEWQEKNDYSVACRWIGGMPRRISWHVNGVKDIKKPLAPQPLQLQQQVIEQPAYQVLIRVWDPDAVHVAEAALRNPAFPLYLGASFCRAVVTEVGVREDVPRCVTGCDWAYRRERLTVGESTPFSCHVVNAEKTGERIVADGFWIYPTPMHPPELTLKDDPCVCGYRRLSTESE